MYDQHTTDIQLSVLRGMRKLTEIKTVKRKSKKNKKRITIFSAVSGAARYSES